MSALGQERTLAMTWVAVWPAVSPPCGWEYASFLYSQVDLGQGLVGTVTARVVRNFTNSSRRFR
jgi:hypothetical protein